MAKRRKSKSNIRQVATKQSTQATKHSIAGPGHFKKYRLAYLFSVCLLVMASLWFVLGKNKTPLNSPVKDQSTTVIPTPAETPTFTFKDGSAYWCRQIPPFISKLNLQQPVAIDTSQTVKPGVMVREVRGQKREYQHPSWRMSGHTSPAVMDKQANLYVVPIPTISLDTNPVSKRNMVYRIDASTGKMSEFMQVVQESGSGKHPYGNVGITFDCDSEFLYVSNVAASGPYKEQGNIYQIDPKQRKIMSQLPQIDAIGLAVFNYQGKKRLYFGSARNSALYSIGLDQQGRFLNDKRYELSLANLPQGDTTSIKKIVFNKNPQGHYFMSLSETKFGFRLVGETAYRIKKYQFMWQPQSQSWSFQGINWQ